MAKSKKIQKISKSRKKWLRERKRTQKAIQDSQEKLLQKVKEKSLDNGSDIRVAPPDTEKMSEIIIHFAKPLLDVAKNDAEEKKAFTIAILLWNLSFLPENKQTKYREQILAASGVSPDTAPSLVAANNNVIDILLERKKRLFPNITRSVIDYSLVKTPKGLHLNIVSNILKKEIDSKKK